MELKELYEQVSEFGRQLPSYDIGVERYDMGDNVIASVSLSRTRVKDKIKNRIITSIKFTKQ